MANEGSRMNPFSMNQFNSLVNSDHWQGGWVTHDEGLVYHSQNLNMCSCDGSRNNPIPSSFYEEMLERGIWLGGWVSFVVIMYCDKHGAQYNSSIGQENYPCSMNIFNEMVSNGIWEGGWIEDSDGSKRYVRNFPVELISGDGCGCGSSGCGSGSGCGSNGGCDGCDGCSGSEIEALGYKIKEGHSFPGVVRGPNGRVGYIEITWSAGKTYGDYELAVGGFSIDFHNSNYIFCDNNIHTGWEGPYIMSINGTFAVHVASENKTHPYSINATYTIPEEFHVYDHIW